ncbi:MAG TPA: hypothetical protein VFL83_18350 [Anaeromyxobacter sp.]|nr:hypothetical protein [Anaeromyxobacter sp.]
MRIAVASPSACRWTRAAALSLAASATIAALPAPASGEDAGPPPAAGPARKRLVEVSFAPFHFDYEERQGGVFLDGEKGGILRALAAAYEVDGTHLFGRVSARVGVGTVAYDGHIQSLDPAWNGLAMTTESDAAFLQGEVQMGAFLDAGRRFALSAAVGARRWKREIQSKMVTLPSTGETRLVLGLDETYRWFEVQAGLRAVVVETRAVEATLEARLVLVAYPSMTVTLPGVADVKLKLAPQAGWRLGGNGRFAISKRGFVMAGAWAEAYSFGASTLDPTYGVYEPPSTTRNVGVEVGLGKRF